MKSEDGYNLQCLTRDFGELGKYFFLLVVYSSCIATIIFCIIAITKYYLHSQMIQKLKLLCILGTVCITISNILWSIDSLSCSISGDLNYPFVVILIHNIAMAFSSIAHGALIISFTVRLTTSFADSPFQVSQCYERIFIIVHTIGISLAILMSISLSLENYWLTIIGSIIILTLYLIISFIVFKILILRMFYFIRFIHGDVKMNVVTPAKSININGTSNINGNCNCNLKQEPQSLRSGSVTPAPERIRNMKIKSNYDHDNHDSDDKHLHRDYNVTYDSGIIEIIIKLFVVYFVGLTLTFVMLLLLVMVLMIDFLDNSNEYNKWQKLRIVISLLKMFVIVEQFVNCVCLLLQNQIAEQLYYKYCCGMHKMVQKCYICCKSH